VFFVINIASVNNEYTAFEYEDDADEYIKEQIAEGFETGDLTKHKVVVRGSDK
jgi:hypothetical protein